MVGKKVTIHMRTLQSVPMPRANLMKRFFWFCSGADLSILRTWDCSTEHNTYAGIGATIFLTAVLASISGGYALWTVFQSYPSSINLLYLCRNLLFSKQLLVQWSSSRTTRCAGMGGALGVPWRTGHTDTTSPCTARAARRIRA